MSDDSTDAKKLYERLYVAAVDLRLALQYVEHLLKNGWHSAPYECRGSIYLQQSALVTALIVSYARPFTRSFGWPRFVLDPLYDDPSCIELHERLINLRHQVYAHTDSSHFKVQPWRLDSEVLTDIYRAPFHRLSEEECELLTVMIDGVLARLSPVLDRMQAEIADLLEAPPTAQGLKEISSGR
ncbi:hypothetical protein D9M68_643810 [compost metagenome]